MAEVVVTTKGPVSEAWIHLFETQRVPIPTTNAQEPLWYGSDETAVGSFAMHPIGDGRWSGQFPLEDKGKYCIELKNELGHANRPIKDKPRFRALTDRQPIVRIDRPAADLTLTRPRKIALIITAEDDYGLAELILSVRRDNESRFLSLATIRTYHPHHQPVRVETLIYEWDLAAAPLALKNSDVLHYRVEARDRSGRAEAAASKDYFVAIRNDASADDKLLEAFEKGHDRFREMLTQLIAEQATVKQGIDKAAVKFDGLNDKIKQAVIAVQLKPELGPDGKPLGPKDPLNSPLTRLDPDALKNLDALR
jgi:hypothetical protein